MVNVSFWCLSIYIYYFTYFHGQDSHTQYSLHLGPYLPTILKNILSLFLQIFQYLEAFESNITSE